MSIKLTCPKCHFEFEPGDAVSKEYDDLLQSRQQELNKQAEEWKQKREEEYAKKEKQMTQQLQVRDDAFQKQLLEEREKVRTQTEEFLRKQLSADHDHQMKVFQQSLQEKDELLKSARAKELEHIKNEQALKTAQEELEINLQKRVAEERDKMSEQLKKEQAERLELKENDFKLKLKEMEEKLEQQKKLADEMKRRAEQGSTQLQGEVQELVLEDMLQQAFPFDVVEEVGKGKRGADCILRVRNQYGQICGSILFESKRTKDWGNDWTEKLKSEMRNINADVAVLVSQVMPKDLHRFGAKDGVWVCSFAEAKPLVAVLRESILKIYLATAGQENKGDKMTMLYDYLTGHEFKERWKALSEGFLALRMSIIKERDAMERIWKQREKQLDKVLLSASTIRGSIEGISGMDVGNLDLLEEGDDLLE